MRFLKLGPTIGLVVLLMAGCSSVATKIVRPGDHAYLGEEESVPDYETPRFARDALGRDVHQEALALMQEKHPPAGISIYDDIFRTPLVYATLVTWDTFVVATAATCLGAGIWAEVVTCCCARGAFAEAGVALGGAIIEAGLIDEADANDLVP